MVTDNTSDPTPHPTQLGPLAGSSPPSSLTSCPPLLLVLLAVFGGLEAREPIAFRMASLLGSTPEGSLRHSGGIRGPASRHNHPPEKGAVSAR